MPLRKLAQLLTLLTLAVALGLLLRPSAPSPAPVAGPDVATPQVPTAAASPVPDLTTWLQAAATADQAAWLEAGRTVLTQRRAALKQLIVTNPEAALAAALSYPDRAQVPAGLQDLLETPFSTVADYDVVATCSTDPRFPALPLERTLHVDGAARQAHTFGDRVDTTTKRGLPAFGIYIDEAAAVSPEPIRQLTSRELAARGFPADAVVGELAGRLETFASLAELQAQRAALIAAERELGPDSLAITLATPARGGAVVARAGAITVATSSVDESPVFLNSPGATGAVITTPNTPIAASTYATGAKKLLYIRARFSDEAATYEPISLAAAQSSMTNIQNYFAGASYGALSFASTFTTTIVLPQPSTYYSSANFATLLNDTKAAAKATNAAWDSTKFNQYVVITSNKAGKFSYAGRAYVGSPGLHALNNYNSLRTVGHELGHNLGLFHAGYYRTDATTPNGRDRIGAGGYVPDTVDSEYVEYGHRFSLMSAQFEGDFDNATKPHFSAYEKVRLSWLKNSFSVASESGTYRLRRLDTTTAGGIQGLRIARNGTDYTKVNRKYWLNYRRAFNTGTAGAHLPYGVQIDWSPEFYLSKGTIQLDMTPFSNNDSTAYLNTASPSGSYWSLDNADKEDGVLIVGRTYSDTAADIHITPVAVGGETNQEWIDVRIELASAGNRAPTLSLQASKTEAATGSAVTFSLTGADADGDTLYYHWDFGDNSVVPAALNNATATKSWTTAGRYTVRATVSDAKGGTASAKVVVTVGTPAATGVVWGRVLCGGLPVPGARVFVDSIRQTWTLADGTYALAGLTPGTNYTVQARRDGLTLNAQFPNPVVAATSPLYGYDFHSQESTGLLSSVAAATAGAFRITVSPYEATLAYGSTLQYRATVWDALTGTPLTQIPAWVSSGAAISSTGLLTANQAAPAALITAALGLDRGTAQLAFVGTAPVTTPAVVTVASTSTSLAEGASGPAKFTFTRTGATTEALTVNLAYSGTATAAADVSGATATVVFAAGASTTNLNLLAVDDALVEGNETLTLAVANGSGYTLGGTVTSTLTLVDNDGFAAWSATAELAAPGTGAAGGDPDGDGLPTLLEYALALDPAVASNSPTNGVTPGAPRIEIVGSALTLTYVRDTRRTDVGHQVEVTTDLANWSAVSDTLVSTNAHWETRRASVPLIAAPAAPAPTSGASSTDEAGSVSAYHFLRLRVWQR